MMKRALAIAAIVSATLGGTVMVASQAEASGGDCGGSWQKQNVNLAPDKWRVYAQCNSLHANSKARGTGVVSAGPDHHTAWFTALHTTYYSSWGIGAIDSVKIETADL